MWPLPPLLLLALPMLRRRPAEATRCCTSGDLGRSPSAPSPGMARPRKRGPWATSSEGRAPRAARTRRRLRPAAPSSVASASAAAAAAARVAVVGRGAGEWRLLGGARLNATASAGNGGGGAAAAHGTLRSREAADGDVDLRRAVGGRGRRRALPVRAGGAVAWSSCRRQPVRHKLRRELLCELGGQLLGEAVELLVEGGLRHDLRRQAVQLVVGQRPQRRLRGERVQALRHGGPGGRLCGPVRLLLPLEDLEPPLHRLHLTRHGDHLPLHDPHALHSSREFHSQVARLPS
mmetsp:Transcript_109223/g.282352  ORF Transcript_109223/g.282352 Transcript_109223/m.282352 type:complete len:291 (+) Transcript_109223:167-1039(+)